MIWDWQQNDWPVWRYESTVLKAKEETFLLQSGRLIEAWNHLSVGHQVQLKVDLLSDEAVKTSAIEGEFLDRVSVQSSVRQQFGLATDQKSAPAARGIAELMVSNYENFHLPLTHEQLWNWHKMVCGNRSDIKVIGDYRKHLEPMQVVSGAVYQPTVHFEAPPSSQMKTEMETFLNWFANSGSEGKEALPALLRSGLCHLYFVSIHPFEDGNGRIARALSEKVLAQALGQPSLLALSRVIEKDRKAYYLQLERHNKTMRVTGWLVWFADTILSAQNYSSQLIDHLIQKTRLQC